MQTFITVATRDYREIAKTLDNKRLNKQALEAWQILMTLTELDPKGDYRKPRGWVNHPAVRMWRGHENALYMYLLDMVDEWKSRGFKSTIAEKAQSTMQVAWENHLVGHDANPPAWFTKKNLDVITSTHRQALLVKDYSWYSQFHWPEDTGIEPKEYEYVWPV